MKTGIRSTDDLLVIYHETKSVIVFSVFMAVVFIIFGAVFLYVGISEEMIPFIIFGSIFSLAPLYILLDLPKYYRRMKKDEGSIVLSANKNGISIASLVNMKPVDYSWDDISRISLVKKMVEIKTGGKSYSNNLGIVYFRRGNSKDQISLMDRSKKQVWYSPMGRNISVFDLPKNNINIVKEALNRFSSNRCEIYSYNRVFFNYAERTEKVQP